MKVLTNAILAGASLFAMTTPVYAQAADDTTAEAGEEPEILVSTRRREESVQDVPATVQAVTAESIEKLNLRKFQDIEAVVPGLSLVPNQNGIGSVSTIRGVDFNVNVSGNNGTIEFYVNDSPVSSNILFQSMFDVGQIEVQRGPQGTLRGRASPSGAIAVTMRKPDLSGFGGQMLMTANDIGGYNANAALNVPIVRDKVAVRLAGVISNDKGNLAKPLNNALPLKNDTQGERASVRVDPLDGVIVLDFMYQHLKRLGHFYPHVESANQVSTIFGASPVTFLAKDRRAVDGFQADNDQAFKSFNWTGQLNLAGQSLTYTGMRFRQRLIAFDPSDDAGIFSNDVAAGNRFGQPTNTHSVSKSHEVRLQNKDRIGGFLDYVVGYLKYDTASNTNLFSPTGIGVVTPVPVLANVALTPIRRFQASKENSIFGNLTGHIGEMFEISGGVRKIKYKNDAGLAINGVINPTFTTKDDVGKTIYQGSAKFKVSDDFMVYATTGTSWRPPVVAITTGLPAATAVQASYLKAGAETSTSYEVGFKSDLLDRRVKLNVALYQQKFKNYPYRNPGTGVYTINTANNSVILNNFVAGVPVKVTGLEAEVEARPTDNLSVGMVFGYAKGIVNGGTIPCTDLNGDGNPDSLTSAPTLAQLQAATGAAGLDVCNVTLRANNAPRLSASVQAEYNTSLGSSLDGFVRGLYSAKGDSKNDPVNAFDNVKAYGILNLYAGVRGESKHWEVTFFAKNVFNKFAVIGRSNGPITTALRGGIPLGPLGTSQGTSSITNYFGDLRTTDPREFGVSLKFSFGPK